MNSKQFSRTRLLGRLLLFGLLLIVLDYFVGNALEWMFFHQKSGVYYRTTFGLEESEADIFIFGSSSANHHFVPEILSQKLGMTVFNQGRDSMETLYSLAILKGILKRHVPNIAILNLTPSELSSVDGYERLFTLLPFYNRHPEMQEIIRLRSKLEPIKLISKIYPFNSTIVTLINGLFGSKPKRANLGYIPLHTTMNPDGREIKTFKEEPELDENRVNALESFILHCKDNSVHLFVVFSPWFYVETSSTATIRKTVELCEKHDVPLFNHILDRTFLGKSDLFMDEGHLNHKGATLFSNIVVQRIKRHLSGDS